MDADRILFLVAVVLFTLVAAVIDVRSRKIPNWLTVPAFLAGVVFHTIHSGWHGLGLSLGGFATGFCILLVLMAVGGGGGGDVKLMAALGAWLGYKAFLAVFVLGTVFVLVASVFIVLIQAIRRRPNTEPVSDVVASHRAPPAARLQITYALPVALATWVVLAWLTISHHDSLLGNPERGMTESNTNQSGMNDVKTSALQSSFKAGVAFTQINPTW